MYMNILLPWISGKVYDQSHTAKLFLHDSSKNFCKVCLILKGIWPACLVISFHQWIQLRFVLSSYSELLKSLHKLTEVKYQSNPLPTVQSKTSVRMNHFWGRSAFCAVTVLFNNWLKQQKQDVTTRKLARLTGQPPVFHPISKEALISTLRALVLNR